MKTTLLTLTFTLILLHSLHAQPTVYYGTNAGTLGEGSTHVGLEAGQSTTAGERYNSYFGYQTGKATTQGGGNTGMGYQTLAACGSCFDNVAIGVHALRYASGASANVAIGVYAQQYNSTGGSNTAVGHASMQLLDTGDGNTGLGSYSLAHNRTGSNNTAVGIYSLEWATGSNNTAMGFNAMGTDTYVTGHFNSAFGSNALLYNETGSLNSAFGTNAGPTSANLMNTTALGHGAAPTASNQVRIGNTAVTSIGGKVSWSTLSDGRFKKEIREDVSGLEFISHLRPVSYVIDEQAINKFLKIPEGQDEFNANAKKVVSRQTGFIAQEVEALIKKTGYVFHGVEAPQSESDHYSIRYAEFVVPLVKAVQELKAEVDNLKQQLDESKETVKGAKTGSGPALYQNNPNPFSWDTEIGMTLPETFRSASIIVYNLEGKQLKAIPVGERGKATVKIQANELTAGMYIYALIVDGKVVDSKKMILTE